MRISDGSSDVCSSDLQASRFHQEAGGGSVIACLINLSPEYPIGPDGIAEDDRHQYARADQHEDLAAFRGGRLPYRHPPRHDIGPDGDGEADHRQGEYDEGEEKRQPVAARSEEHTSELQSLMRISYAVFCLK